MTLRNRTLQPSVAPALSPARDRANAPLVIAAAVVTMLLWASAFVVIRSVGTHFGPGSMALLRMIVGGVALGIVVAVRGVVWPPRRSWLLIAVWGFAHFGLYNVALNAAERMIDAGTAAMLVNLAPLIVVLLAGSLLGEGYPRGLVVGAPVAFAGVALIGTASASGQTGSAGALLALASAVLFAGSTLLQKVLLRTVDASTLTWLGAVAGTVSLLPWAGDLGRELGHAPAPAVAGVLYLGVFPTAVAFTTWAYVLGRASAGRTSATSYLVPALTVVIAWFVLGEAPTPAMFVGGALCLFGVFLTRLPARALRRS